MQQNLQTKNSPEAKMPRENQLERHHCCTPRHHRRKDRSCVSLERGWGQLILLEEAWTATVHAWALTPPHQPQGQNEWAPMQQLMMNPRVALLSLLLGTSETMQGMCVNSEKL